MRHGSVTEEKLRQHVLDRAAPPIHPRRVWFLDSFPVTDTNKIDRKKLMAEAEKRVRGEKNMHKKIDDGFDGLVSDLQKTLSYQTEASGYDPDAAHPFRKHIDGGTGRFPRCEQKSHEGSLPRNVDNMAGCIDTSDGASLPLYGLMCHVDVVPAQKQAKMTNISL